VSDVLFLFEIVAVTVNVIPGFNNNVLVGMDKHLNGVRIAGQWIERGLFLLCVVPIYFVKMLMNAVEDEQEGHSKDADDHTDNESNDIQTCKMLGRVFLGNLSVSIGLGIGESLCSSSLRIELVSECRSHFLLILCEER